MAQGGDYHRSHTQAKKKAEIAGRWTKKYSLFFCPPTSNFRFLFACPDVEEQ
jgi:hypothetical protein